MKNELTLPGVHVTEHGIVFPEDLSREDWTTVLTTLKAIHDGYHAALADTIAYGTANFGEEVVQATCEQLEFPQADFNQARDISKIPVGLRKNAEGLTAEHFHVVGHTFGDDDIKQKKWIETASNLNLTPRELRRSIEKGEVIRDDAKKTGRNSGGILTIQAITMTFSKWKEQVGGDAVLESWSDEEKRAFIQQTHEFATFRLQIVKSLAPK